jgi:CubicO group peptidase (beta-lactamase class C family)
VLAPAAGVGDDVPRAVAERITGPLGLRDTGYDYGAPGVAARLAAGYDASGEVVPWADLGWWFPGSQGHQHALSDDILHQ